jgi:hypothetical protein
MDFLRRIVIGAGGSTEPFASPCGTLRLQMFQSKEPLGNSMFLVELLNWTFEREPSRNRDSNVKFAPLARMPRAPRAAKRKIAECAAADHPAGLNSSSILARSMGPAAIV